MKSLFKHGKSGNKEKEIILQDNQMREKKGYNKK